MRTTKRRVLALGCALGPALAETEFERERRIALDELVAERDDLATLAFHAAAAKLYGNHPYGRRRRGTADSLRGLDSGDLRRLWQGGYPIGRASIGLCGDFDPHATVEAELALETRAASEERRELDVGEGRLHAPQPSAAALTDRGRNTPQSG